MEIERALAVAATAAEGARSSSASQDKAGCSSQDPNEKEKCTGQQHHAIGKKIWQQAQQTPALKGVYKYRDPRFVTHAKDLKAHCGYQDFHIKLDDEVVAHLRNNPGITPSQFETYLRQLYQRPDLLSHFPNGF